MARYKKLVVAGFLFYRSLQFFCPVFSFAAMYGGSRYTLTSEEFVVIKSTEQLKGYDSEHELQYTVESVMSVFASTSAMSGGEYSLTSDLVSSLDEEAAAEDLGEAHVYPNPCNSGKGCEKLMFTELTQEAEIDIYTVSGELVRKIAKRDTGNKHEWDLRNDYGKKVSSGLYLYYIKADNSVKKGKFVIIR